MLWQLLIYVLATRSKSRLLVYPQLDHSGLRSGVRLLLECGTEVLDRAGPENLSELPPKLPLHDDSGTSLFLGQPCAVLLYRMPLTQQINIHGNGKEQRQQQ